MRIFLQCWSSRGGVLQVAYRSEQQLRVIVSLSEHRIAVVTQEASHLPGRVTVIDD